MTDTRAGNVPARTAFTVLVALAELGEATAAQVAEHAGLAYSTTTPKLRAWEGSGQVQRSRAGDGRTLWRLTDAGRAATTGGSAPQARTASATADSMLASWAAEKHGGNVDVSPAAAQQQPRTGGDAPDPSAALARCAAGATSDAPADGEGQASPEPETSSQGRETVEPGPDGSRTGTSRRSGGALRGAVLGILEAHPDRQYKTGELAKLIDAANGGSGAAKASAGAVANAAIKLVADGQAVQTVERPATFQLATGGR
ncbi:MarR family winged helix-turn-helix transcriptional regulator [Micromonospora sp. CPCC 205556]|uniref:MarR family winged helix-turn-helix transcriptional regulator n=1 Tax=Micromonospora sp. CPCC 205556 TaxID=3122398 RepID=UPI002FF0D88C